MIISSIAVTSITLFFSRIRDRMVRGETWFHWQKWMSGTLPNQDRIFSLLADGTGPLFVSQLLCHFSSSGTVHTERVRSTATTTRILQEEKKASTRNSPWRTDPGWIHDNLLCSWVYPSIHPPNHPSI